MKPYYQDDSCTIYHGDCREILPSLDGVVVSDPPYNVGYHYSTYADDLEPSEYWQVMKAMLRPPCAVLHYPESLFDLAWTLQQPPSKCAAWVYNANTPRQWRMVAWFGIVPDFTLLGQPYKNTSDKRIQKRIAEGKQGRLYDWWLEPQIKNVSAEKTTHPCQIPESIPRPSAQPFRSPPGAVDRSRASGGRRVSLPGSVSFPGRRVVAGRTAASPPDQGHSQKSNVSSCRLSPATRNKTEAAWPG